MDSVVVRALLFLLSLVAVASSAAAFDGCRYADVSGDGKVGTADYRLLEEVLGLPHPRRDLDGNGTVGKEDIAILLGFLGAGCSKSCPADLDDDSDVDEDDRALLEADYGLDCRPDLDRDGLVDGDGGDDDDADVLFAYLDQPAPPHTAEARGDLRVDQYVDEADFEVLAASIPRDCRGDLNSDGQIDMTDTWALLSSWGACP